MVKHLNTLSILSYVVGATSILWFFYGICNGIANYGYLKDPSTFPQMFGPAKSNQEIEMLAMFGMAASVCFGIGSLLGAGLNFMAAGKFKSGESRSFLLFVSALNLIPCLASCCLIGMPIGLYGLIVLNNAQVKEYFAADDPAERRRMTGADSEDETE